MYKVAFDPWYKAADFEVLDFQSVDICESGKVAQAIGADFGRYKPGTHTTPLLHSDFFYERHIT